MIPRFTTNHPYFGLGIYLSEPGINARTSTNPDDFLLHSGYKNEQVIKCGTLQLNPLATVRVDFAAALPSRPLVFNFMPFSSTTVILPWPVEVGTVDWGGAAKNYRVEAEAFTTHVNFISRGAILTYVSYMVMARGV